MPVYFDLGKLMRQNTSVKANLLLLITAAIWGFAFVAQRAGMEYLGPFTFNGIRFLLGTLSLLPVAYLLGRRNAALEGPAGSPIGPGLICGLFLFAGASFQQIGIQYTTAGKAGFITGMYVVLVPFFGLLLGRMIGAKVWFGALLAAAGLYLLSVTDSMRLERGDALVLFSAVFWALHVLAIDRFVLRVDALKLAVTQFTVCTVLSIMVAGALETASWDAIRAAAVPLFYAGVMSVGVAYTLQVIAQQEAHPAHVAIILSLEGVFAVLGGWLLLNEWLTPRMAAGCALMLAAMVVAQWRASDNA